MCAEDKPTGTRMSGWMRCPEDLRKRYYGHRSGYVILVPSPSIILKFICKSFGHKWKVYNQYETGYIDYLKDQCQRCYEMRGIDY